MQNRVFGVLLLIAGNSAAAGLRPAADQAFQDAAAKLEAGLTRQHASPESFLAVLDAKPGQRETRQSRLASGDLLVEPVESGNGPAGGALLHHWRGAAFVPKATPAGMLALLRDFDHLSDYYAPEIVSSRALGGGGENATLAVRFKQRMVVTIVLDAEYEIETKLLGDDRGYSSSRSMHIWQIDNPGSVNERRRPPGADDGFLWRLNSYWSFARASLGHENRMDGLLIECEALSLTRSVPVGLGWLITPILADLPRQELEFTLRSTRNALSARVAQRTIREEKR